MHTATAAQREVSEARLDTPRGPLPFRLFKTQSGFQIVQDIFAGTTYPHVHFVSDVATILDIGANVGAAAVYFSTLYPGARIYAFEPASAPFSLLQSNVGPFANIKAFHFGCHASARQARLYPGRVDSVESSVVPTGRTEAESEDIRLVAAPDFLAERGIERVDILKLDTEGCEVPILRSLRDYLPAVKVLYVEYHSERDRRLIDGLMAETHVLWRGQVALAYRGEFCYLNRRLLPNETYTSEILLPLD